MASTQLENVRKELSNKLHQPNQFTNILAKIESKTGIDRVYQVAGVVGLFSLYLIFGYFAELVCNVIGFLYPAYASMKALESPSKDDDTQWLTYWVVFALFNVVEFWVDIIAGWFPVYWLCKCALMLYLYLPMTMGAQKFYVDYVRPFMQKYEPMIESKLGKVMGKTADAVKGGADLLKQQ